MNRENKTNSKKEYKYRRLSQKLKIETSNLSLIHLTQFEKDLIKLTLFIKSLGIIIFLLAHNILGDNHDYLNNALLEYKGDRLPPFKKLVFTNLIALCKWDGLMFLKVIFYGYDNLKLHAFFPGFPYVVKGIIFFSNAILKHILGDFNKQALAWQVCVVVLVAAILNLILNGINAIYIYR